MDDSIQQSRDSTNELDTRLLVSQLTKTEEQANYFRNQYNQMRMINESMIKAIKRVFSPQIGQELEMIMDGSHSICSKMRNATLQDFDNSQKNDSFQLSNAFEAKELTDTIVEMMAINHTDSHRKASNCSPSVAKSPLPKRYFLTPTKYQIQDSSYQVIEPLSIGQNNSFCHNMKTSREASSNRTSVATQLLCELCRKCYPPNQFFNHMDACKATNSRSCSKCTRQCSSREPSYRKAAILTTQEIEEGKDLNYTQVMENLLQIREEIEEQIGILKCSKEKVNRVTLRKKLEKDLAQIVDIINSKENAIKKGSGKFKPKKYFNKMRM